LQKFINMLNPQKETSAKNEQSFFETLGLGSIEIALQKIPFIGKALPFLLINIVTASIFYSLCYGLLWLLSAAAEEEGQWFVRRVDMLGKSYTRLTTHAAEQIAFFIAGIAACLFTFNNYKENSKTHFLIKAAWVALIPLGFLLLTNASTMMNYYIPIGFIYGQFLAIIIVCMIKLFGGDKKATHA
jgi:hypothetical protein